MIRYLIAGFLAALVAVGLLAEAYINIRPGLYAAVISTFGASLFLLGLRPAYRKEMASRILLTVIAFPIFAWALPNLWQLLAIMCIWVPLVARTLKQIAPVYLFSLLMLPGLDVTVSAGALKLFDFGAQDALAVGASAAVFLSRGKASPRLRYDIAVMAVVLQIGIALARDTTFSNFLRTSVNVSLDLWLPYYILSRSLRSIEDLKRIMCWLGCGSVTLTAVLTYEVWRAWPIYNELYVHYQVPTLLLVKVRGGLLRASGPFVEPTSAAMVMAMCVLALWLSRDFFRSRATHLCLLAVALIGLSVPQSRGAWVGLLLGMAVADFTRGLHVALTKKFVLVGIAAAFVFAAALSSPYLSETVGLSGGSSETSDYRRLLFERGMKEFWHSPLFGFSNPELLWRLKDLRQGEGIIDFVNTYIWILLISGAIGFFIFTGTLLFFLHNVWRSYRTTPRIPGSAEVATYIVACLAMLMEMLFFTSFGGRPAFFMFGLFGCAAAFLSCYRRNEPLSVPDNVFPIIEGSGPAHDDEQMPRPALSSATG